MAKEKKSNNLPLIAGGIIVIVILIAAVLMMNGGGPGAIKVASSTVSVKFADGNVVTYPGGEKEHPAYTIPGASEGYCCSWNCGDATAGGCGRVTTTCQTLYSSCDVGTNPKCYTGSGWVDCTIAVSCYPCSVVTSGSTGADVKTTSTTRTPPDR